MKNILSKLGLNSKEFIPESYICFKDGSIRSNLFNDIVSGIGVGIIALPLAMAFAIGSGVLPEKGLFTAIVAGFLISLLGGSRVQIGGPTGAYVIIIYSIVQRHGYEGLATATLIAGIMLVLMGFARLGVLLKFIPFPVITGFTTGIALVIFSSQIKDFLGLSMDKVPADFLDKWTEYANHLQSGNPWAFVIGAVSLATLFLFKRYYPKIPGAIIVIVFGTLFVSLFGIPVETIEARFGEIPRMLPSPCLPKTSFEHIRAVFPDAISIALLGAIESLLCAVVADGLTGYRHRSNCELVAQGLGNIGSVIFGGIPATGAIARTSANIRMGGRTPLAGIIHAVTLLLLMVLFAPLAGKIPLTTLAAILVFVAWNMSEMGQFKHILFGQKSDACVLAITFLLTVLIDLTVAVQVGVLLAVVLFLKHMTDRTTVTACSMVLHEGEKENHPIIKDTELLQRKDVPEEVTIFELRGPLFFAVAGLLEETLDNLQVKPKFFILRMRHVPIIDMTGMRALKMFATTCKEKGIVFILSGVRPDQKELFKKMSVEQTVGQDHIFANIDEALGYVKRVD